MSKPPVFQQTQTQTAHKHLLFLALLALTVYGTSMFITGLFQDDLVWLWVVKFDGFGALFDYMFQASHPGYWPPLSFFYKFGGDNAGLLARVIGLICHFANSLLLLHIFNRIRFTKDISLYAAAIYLLSPFYYARGTLGHNIYDIFMLFFLLSVWFCRSGKKAHYVLALLFYCMSLSFETLIFLEPLRTAFLDETKIFSRKIIRQCAPFWAIAVLFVFARVVWLKPFGNYAGYNKITFSLIGLTAALWGHAKHYINGVWFTLDTAAKLSGGLFLVIFIATTVFLMWLFDRNSNQKTKGKRIENSSLLKKTCLGLLLTVLGALPYAVGGRMPNIYDFYSRIAYVSIPGIALLIATVIRSVPVYSIRKYIFCTVVVVLSFSSLHITKWYIYDSLIQADFNYQFTRKIKPNNEQLPLFHLKYIPDSSSILLLNRMLRGFDMNVPPNILRNNPDAPILFYNDMWPRESNTFFCGITSFHRYPCPEQTVRIEYTLKPEYTSVEKVPYRWLLWSVLKGKNETLQMGKVTSPDGWLNRHISE